MSLTEGSRILAEDFIILKERVKAEMLRRSKGKGKLIGYDTDYTIMPSVDERVLSSHVNELIDPLNLINDTGYSSIINCNGLCTGSCTSSCGNCGGSNTSNVTENIIMELDTLDAKLTVWESIKKTSTDHGCNANCTGLCSTGCYGTASGSGSGGTGEDSGDDAGGDSCNGLCTGTCSGACGNCGGCGTTCSGSCSGTSGGCSTCDGTCVVSAS